MIRRMMKRLACVALCALILFGAFSAHAAAIAVPATRLTDQTSAITANAIKPNACSGMTLTRVVVCTGGNCDGSNANELMIGTSAGERIRGRGGTDCILGGGGDDHLVGNGKSDVCLGGPGSDTVTSCESSFP